MPTILFKDGFRFYFFSDEGNEPCHIHMKKGGGRGKVWLLPELSEDYYYGFTAQEIKKIRKIVDENYENLIEKWHGHFDRF